MTAWACAESRTKLLSRIDRCSVRNGAAIVASDARWLDVAPFRELCCRTIREEGISWRILADRMGYKPYRGTVDAIPLLRAIGLTPASAGKRSIRYDVAARIVDACNAYPVDFGI